ncbi:hypothetical protein P8935_08245 [Telmatobacter sp. DSM 110680]|uniref:GGDEF domain-containing protein n=1 Tax=Telmatobacter sp. DSM 110680 TaxID=3036704 RepID=A0AAU7DN22_9BACT
MGRSVYRPPRDRIRCLCVFDQHEFVDQAATGGGHEAEFSAVVRKGRAQNARRLQQVTIQIKRGDHVACIVCDLRDIFASSGHGGQNVDDLVHALLFYFT